MRALIFTVIAAAVLANSALASEPEVLQQRFMAIRILDGNKTLLETQLAVIVGFEAYASNVLPGGGRQSPSPFTLPAGSECYVKITGEGAPNLAPDSLPEWFMPPDNLSLQKNMVRCGGMLFEITAPAGSRFEVVVCKVADVDTRGGNAVFAGRVEQQPEVISSLSVELQ